MKKSLNILLIVSIVGILINVCYAQVISKSRNSLLLLNRVKDVGVIKNDTPIKEKFYFVNVSNSDVEIDYVKPDCTCSGFTLSKNPIHPQDTAYIELVYNPKNDYGVTRVHATIKTKTKEMHLITLKAKVN